MNKRLTSVVALFAGGVAAGLCALPPYTICTFTAMNGTIAGLNDSGPYLQTVGGGWQLVTASGTTNIATATGSLRYISLVLRQTEGLHTNSLA